MRFILDVNIEKGKEMNILSIIQRDYILSTHISSIRLIDNSTENQFHEDVSENYISLEQAQRAAPPQTTRTRIETVGDLYNILLTSEVSSDSPVRYLAIGEEASKVEVKEVSRVLCIREAWNHK